MFAFWATAIVVSLAALAPLQVDAGKGFTGKRVVAGYVPGYAVTPSQVPYKQFTHLDYFVFTTTWSAYSISTAGIEPATIQDFVNRARANGVTMSFTLGGWTGSKYFSTHVSTAYKRLLFAKTLNKVLKQYSFSGIDIDWEYPGAAGQDGNIISPQDASNLALFLKTLRSVVGPDVRLSMAVPNNGVIGADGSPLTNLRDFASVLDYITCMNYDIVAGGFSWSETTGPNSPLYDSCAPDQLRTSADRAVRYLVAAGFARNHILLGFPAYAYTWTVSGVLTKKTCPDGSTSVLYQKKYNSQTCTGNWVGEGIGQVLWSEISDNKWLQPGSGFTLYRDKSTQTIALYNATNDLFIPTEDATTAKAKGAYVRAQNETGLRQRPPAGYVPKVWPAAVAAVLYFATAAMIWFQWARMGRQKFLLVLPIGLTTMCIGYILRIVYAEQFLFSVGMYAIMTLFVLLSPCLFLAFDYVLLSRLSSSLGEDIADKCLFLPSRLIVKIFVWTDVFVFFLQGSGGGLSAIDSDNLRNIGEKTMIVGLVIQVIAFGLFTLLLLVFAFRVRKNFPEHWFVSNSEGIRALNGSKQPVRDWRILLVVMGLTCIGIIIRCVFRAIEYGDGYDGYLATEEVFFYLLDALPLWLAMNLYCLFWPGRLLHKGQPLKLAGGVNPVQSHDSSLEMGLAKEQYDYTHYHRARTQGQDRY
ncbi:hypothetical protein OIO90_005386 [Microbotryomycetes sp. JL221]|nr:hypothetical protein OIO90_005386 [Microbotryomycetes sp. JL221]